MKMLLFKFFIMINPVRQNICWDKSHHRIFLELKSITYLESEFTLQINMFDKINFDF